MNDPKHKEEALQAEIADDTQKLDEGIARVRQNEASKKRELASLKSELPDELFRVAMNQTCESRMREIKARIHELEDDLKDFPMLFQRFNTGRAQIQAKQNQLRMAQRRRAAYEDLKIRFENDPQLAGMSIRSDLLDQAKALDCQQDAESFLAGLERGTAA